MKTFTLIFMIAIISLLVLNGCTEIPKEIVTKKTDVKQPVEEKNVEKEDPKEAKADVIIEPEEKSPGCKVNEDCSGNLQCVNGKCKTITSLYKTDCETRCNFKSVEISSSNGDSYTLNRGQGSYTAAGAVEWKILSGPDYCKGDKVLIPIQLIKKQTGKIISKEVLTMNAGEKTKTITHPNIKSVSFNLEVKKVNEECK